MITERDVSRLTKQGYTILQKDVAVDGGLTLIVNDPVQCSSGQKETWTEYRKVTLRKSIDVERFLNARS